MRFRLAAFADEASGEINGQIRALKENEINLLEIRGVDGSNIADISTEKAKEVRAKFEDAGISIWSLGSPFGKIHMDDDFAPHLESFKRGLETAQILGCRHIRMFSFYGTEGRKSEVFERLSLFLRAAEGTDAILCHENEKGIYGDVAHRCLEIHREFPQIKAVFDPANFIQSGQDTVEAWKMLSPYVEYMHIKDALQGGQVVPAGKGAGNLPYLLSEYKGDVLTVEPHLTVFDGLEKLEGKEKTQINPYSYPDSFTAFKAACDALKSLT
ncbi:MAG: sugar phosphate isomerase/epimerase [Lachnospiraceae bacterium]|nr:sugar phosphate isomerase/epimerase [Lachnospiraceae bacterium]